MKLPDGSPQAVTAADHVRGGHDAAVTIVEYGDYECPSCKKAAPVLLLLLRRLDGRVRFVYRHFPLEEVHANALAAAEASEAAAAQERFWEMHDRLFEIQPHLASDQLLKVAQALDLNVRQFRQELQDHVHLRRIRQDEADGRRLGVRATPTFYVNGTLCDVSFGISSLVLAVEKVLGGAGRAPTVRPVVQSNTRA